MATKHGIQSVNSIITEEAAKNNGVVSFSVERTADIPSTKDTFITQRGGKIIQGILPAPGTSVAMLDNKRSLQSTLLLQRKKEMQEIQDQLEIKREEFARRMAECGERQNELRAKQKQIKERVLKFEKFLKENDAKRLRANAKCISERKLKELKEQEATQLKSQLQKEIIKNQHLLAEIGNNIFTKEQHKSYETYLQSIVDSLPADYMDVHDPQINDIIMRYNTLVETNQDLLAEVQANQDEISKSHQKIQAQTKARDDLLLVSNSKLGAKQKLLDKLKQESAYLEEGIQEKDNTGKERLRIISETKLAIDDLYERIRDQNQKRAASHIDEPMIEATDMRSDLKTWIDKLHALQFRILDLQDIVAPKNSKRN